MLTLFSENTLKPHGIKYSEFIAPEMNKRILATKNHTMQPCRQCKV